MLKLVALAVAGAAGTLARYWLSGSVHRYSKTTFPSGTLVVNIAGCLLIGLISFLFTEYAFFGPDARTVVFVGFVGGFTTFSAFGLETLELLSAGSFLLAGMNILGNVAGGLVAVWLGATLGEGVRAVTVPAPPSRFPARARAIAGAAAIAAALILAFAPLSAPWVERIYANGLHPEVQRALTRATNLVPFALGDLVFAAAILALLAVWVASLRAAGRIGLGRAVGLLLFRTAVLAAGAYLIFLLCWGLNYRRLPLAAKLDDDPARVTPGAARALAARTIRLLDADGALAHQSPWPDDAELVHLLAPTFDAAARQAGDRRNIVPALPKTSLGDAFLGASGTAGFTHPVTHEVVLDRTVLDCEKPFLLAHEWGHLAGFADESEASFVGLCACARSASPGIRYAGWLALYEQLPAAALAAGPVAPGGETMPALTPLVKADLRAIAERAARRRSPWISRLSSRTYDRFLKANRVEAGVASYGLVVRLVLGVRFEEPWVPAPRTPSGADSPAPH